MYTYTYVPMKANALWLRPNFYVTDTAKCHCISLRLNLSKFSHAICFTSVVRIDHAFMPHSGINGSTLTVDQLIMINQTTGDGTIIVVYNISIVA